jgi:hypothetical protein
MGFINDKQEIFNSIAVLSAIQKKREKNRNRNSFASSSTNEKNLIPFFLELLSKIIGNDNLKPILTDVILSNLSKIEVNLKSSFFEIIKSTYICDKDLSLPNISFSLNINEIDFLKKLKNNPNTLTGRYLYGLNPNQDFDLFLYNVIQSGSGVWLNILNVSYNQGIFTFTPTNQYLTNSSPTVFKLLSDFLNNNKFINFSAFTTLLFDFMNGFLSNFKSLDILNKEGELNEIIDKIIKTDISSIEYAFDNSFYSFSNDETYKINSKNNYKLKSEDILNIGCEITEIIFDDNEINDLYDEIKNLELIGNFNEVKKTFSRDFEKIIINGLVNVNDENKNTSLLKIIIDIITNIVKIIANIFLTPKLLFIVKYMNFLINNNLENTTDIIDYIKNNSNIINPFIKSIYNEICSELYTILKKEILELISNIANQVSKEKLNIFINSLKSLNNFLSKIQNTAI